MAFQANIDKVIQDPDAIVIEATYSDGTQKVTKEYRLTSYDLNSFKRLVQSQIDQLGTVDATKVKIDIPLGPFDPTIPAPPPPPPPPPPTARQLFSGQISQLRHIKNAVDLGFAVQSDIDAQFSEMQKTFDPSYLDLF